MKKTAIIIMTMFCLTQARAEDGWSVAQKRENFQLYVNRCGPIGLEVYANIAEEIGLTKELIETAARSRLRATHLYGAETEPVSGILVISVVVASWGKTVLHYQMWFEKHQQDEMSRLSGWSPTGWMRGALVPHNNDARSAIAATLDEFLDDFLRVNECICDPARRFEPKPSLSCSVPFDPFDEEENRIR